MKCGYCSGDVPKEEAVKDGRYYHKKCYRQKQGKREIEEYWLGCVNQGTVLQLLRKVIKDVTEIYDVDYILWVLKKCKERKINLQYPQGMKRLLDDGKFKDEWNKKKSLADYSKIKHDIKINISNDVVFEYKKIKRKATDLI